MVGIDATAVRAVADLTGHGNHIYILFYILFTYFYSFCFIYLEKCTFCTVVFLKNIFWFSRGNLNEGSLLNGSLNLQNWAVYINLFM